MKDQKPMNTHPPKDVCELCRDHNLCLAEDGTPNYWCMKTKENVRDIL